MVMRWEPGHVELADYVGNDRKDFLLAEAAFAFQVRKTEACVYRLGAGVVKEHKRGIDCAKPLVGLMVG
jgi:hypothetical protein